MLPFAFHWGEALAWGSWGFTLTLRMWKRDAIDLEMISFTLVKIPDSATGFNKFWRYQGWTSWNSFKYFAWCSSEPLRGRLSNWKSFLESHWSPSGCQNELVISAKLHLHVHSLDDYNFNLLDGVVPPERQLDESDVYMTRTGASAQSFPNILSYGNYGGQNRNHSMHRDTRDQMRRADGASTNNSYRPRDNNRGYRSNNGYSGYNNNYNNSYNSSNNSYNNSIKRFSQWWSIRRVWKLKCPWTIWYPFRLQQYKHQ